MSAQQSSSVPDGPYPTLPIVNGYVLPVVMKSLFHGTGSYLRTSGICCCWPDCLELFARWHAGSGGFWGLLHTVCEDVFICA